MTFGLSLLLKVPSAQAHGAVVEVGPATVEIKAAFDTGEPMSDAQVLIYSPADVETPWAKGQTDGEGRFVFSPDPSLTGDDAVENGRWEVTVRKAGHGQTTSFMVGNGALQAPSGGTAAPSQSRFTLQHWISVGAIIWGFLGTALYFKAKAEQSAESRADRQSAAIAANVSSDVARSDR
ncbi:MAG: hypothetical protein WA949_10225 [Phormidesmis sp.]